MSRGPRRLKDDPDFKWETGCDLADEGLVVGGHDLPAIKAALLAKIGTDVPIGDGVPTVRPGASAAASVTKPLVGAAVAAAVVLGAYLLGVQTASEPAPAPDAAVSVHPAVTPEVPPVEEHAVAAEPVVVEADDAAGELIEDEPERPVEVEPPQADPVETVAVAPAFEEPSEEAEAESVDSDSDSDAVAVVDAPVEEPEIESVTPPPSEAARALAIYNQAHGALLDGDAAGARAGFQAYLDAYPQRYMWAEASLGLLQAQFAVGDVAATAELAAQLQDVAALEARRDEILLLRAQALVRLDQCGEALQVIEELPNRDGSDIRKACRSR